MESLKNRMPQEFAPNQTSHRGSSERTATFFCKKEMADGGSDWTCAKQSGERVALLAKMHFPEVNFAIPPPRLSRRLKPPRCKGEEEDGNG